MNSYKLTDTILYLDNVSLGYDNKIILKDINLIEKDIIREDKEATGQIIAVIGRSGRGKSTLFKALTGLLKPLSGKILMTDMKTDNTEDAIEVSEGMVGFVDQKYTLFRHKTVFQSCMYALRKTLLSYSEKEAGINIQLKEWGLFEHKDKYPVELSGGQRQRNAICEQLLSSKHFMIFDEPFSGLDCGNIEKVKHSFNLIQNQHELNTIIFSTHDINLAVELADSIYVIGKPSEEADYSTIVKHYDLKEMNLAWKEFGNDHINLVKEIKEVLLKS